MRDQGRFRVVTKDPLSAHRKLPDLVESNAESMSRPRVRSASSHLRSSSGAGLMGSDHADHVDYEPDAVRRPYFPRLLWMDPALPDSYSDLHITKAHGGRPDYHHRLSVFGQLHAPWGQ